MYTYTTKVRIQPTIIEQELVVLRQAYDKIDPTGTLRKESHDARSAFSRWNNLNKFLERLLTNEIPILKKYDDGSLLFEVVASAKGNSARVYFKPSITSLTKEVRKAVIPINDDNVFVYADLKAAEFALRCIQAQEVEAINTYKTGNDIYMHFAPIFPEGTERKVIKQILIANMYGKSAYSTAKDLGCSETQAQRLLDTIASRTPRMTMLKRKIAAHSLRMHGYYSPNGLNQDDLIKVASINPLKGFDPNLAWSAYTQSALGFCMQQFTTKYLNIQKGVEQTTLSIFDSVFFEIKKESAERFKEFYTKFWSPLIADDFTFGTTMYNAAYNPDIKL